MIKECGEITWFLLRDGTLSFYPKGMTHGLNLVQIIEYLSTIEHRGRQDPNAIKLTGRGMNMS